MEEQITAIYGIKDIRTDDIIYVGSTYNFEQRKKDHLNNSIQIIDNYMKKQGRKNFQIFVIKKIDSEQYDIRIFEQYYIDKYNTRNDGFNKHNAIKLKKRTKEKLYKDIEIIELLEEKERLKERLNEIYQKLNELTN